MSYMIYLKKDENHVYAYQATSYRDPITRKPKSRRTYIGRVDPITHEFLNPDDAKKLRTDSTENTDNTEKSRGIQKPEKASVSQNSNSDVTREINKINKTIQSQQATLNSLQKEQKEIRRLFEVIERAIHLSVVQDG